MTGVVLTAVGLQTPFGLDLDPVFYRALKGHHSFEKVINEEGIPVGFGAACRQLSFELLPLQKIRKMLTRKDLLCVLACLRARAAAEFGNALPRSERQGLFVGACSSQINDLFPYFASVLGCVTNDNLTFDTAKFAVEAINQVNPLAAVKVLLNGGLAHACQVLDIQGPNGNYMDLETSGLTALAAAVRAIENGLCDVALAASMSSPFDPFHLNDSEVRHRLWRTVGEAEVSHGVKPYDDTSCGALLSEAGICLVLESAEHAGQRGATPLATIAGLGSGFCESPGKDGACGGLASAIHGALDEAAIDFLDFGVIAGAGIGDKDLDAIELATLRKHASDERPVPLYSLAGRFGDFREAGALFRVAMLCAIFKHERIPPTWNFRAGKTQGFSVEAAPIPLKTHLGLVTARNVHGNAAACVLRR